MRRAPGVFFARRVALFVMLTASGAVTGCHASHLRPGLAPLSVRGAYGHDASASGVDVMRSVGLDTVTASPYREALNELQSQGLKAIGFPTTRYPEPWMVTGKNSRRSPFSA